MLHDTWSGAPFDFAGRFYGMKGRDERRIPDPMPDVYFGGAPGRRRSRTRPSKRTAARGRGRSCRWRNEGEVHLFNPETVFLLQHSTRSRQYDVFERYTQTVDRLSAEAATLRGLFTIRTGERPPVPLDEVEPVSEIVKRFSTGAMSYGSISQEAHQTLAIAMNRLGGKSNTGAEQRGPGPLHPRPNGDLRRSAIKQVASGRFGVTSEYLVNADDIQIKMAQGAKPGEGGQLPGSKVYPWVARTRHSTPGVGLISPPPHHDIYSMRTSSSSSTTSRTPTTRRGCTSSWCPRSASARRRRGEQGHADVVLISGHDGGTGAATLTSLKHAGSPWSSAWPRPSRRCWPTGCATGSPCRWTGR